ncbi:MAG: hypothetical protein J0M20_03720 [Burkholderiales bacterium]|nr:hypothetical protein [Burkholderiales bacterium]
MWWAKSESVTLYLSGSTMALRGPAVEGLRLALSTPDEFRDMLGMWLGRYPGLTWQVLLGGRLCVLQCLMPINGTNSIEEAEAVAAATLSTPAKPWQARLTVWSSHGARPWLAACTPLGLVDELSAMIERGGRLQSLHPWWTTLPRQGRLADAALCDDESVTYWRSGADGAVTEAATFLASTENQASVLRRLRVGGPLSCWQLDLAGWGSTNTPMVRKDSSDAADSTAL